MPGVAVKKVNTVVKRVPKRAKKKKELFHWAFEELVALLNLLCKSHNPMRAYVDCPCYLAGLLRGVCNLLG